MVTNTFFLLFDFMTVVLLNKTRRLLFRFFKKFLSIFLKTIFVFEKLNLQKNLL